MYYATPKVISHAKLIIADGSVGAERILHIKFSLKFKLYCHHSSSLLHDFSLVNPTHFLLQSFTRYKTFINSICALMRHTTKALSLCDLSSPWALCTPLLGQVHITYDYISLGYDRRFFCTSKTHTQFHWRRKNRWPHGGFMRKDTMVLGGAADHEWWDSLQNPTLGGTKAKSKTHPSELRAAVSLSMGSSCLRGPPTPQLTADGGDDVEFIDDDADNVGSGA